MRVAAFADIHGNLPALEAVVADVARRQVDLIVCLGDLVALGPFPGQVLSLVRSLGYPVVQGNTDTWYQEPLPAEWQPADERMVMVHDIYQWLEGQLNAEEISYLHSLPQQQRIGPMLCVHGSPRDQREGMLPDTAADELREMVADVDPAVEVLLCGHTHVPMERHLGSLKVVGVGSVGLPADGDWRPCYALLERTSGGWQVEWPRPEYDLEDAVIPAQATGFPHLEAVLHAWSSGRGLA